MQSVKRYEIALISFVLSYILNFINMGRAIYNKGERNNIGINVRPSIAVGIENIASKAIESVIGRSQCGSLLDK